MKTFIEYLTESMTTKDDIHLSGAVIRAIKTNYGETSNFPFKKGLTFRKPNIKDPKKIVINFDVHTRNGDTLFGDYAKFGANPKVDVICLSGGTVIIEKGTKDESATLKVELPVGKIIDDYYDSHYNSELSKACEVAAKNTMEMICQHLGIKEVPSIKGGFNIGNSDPEVRRYTGFDWQGAWIMNRDPKKMADAMKLKSSEKLSASARIFKKDVSQVDLKNLDPRVAVIKNKLDTQAISQLNVFVSKYDIIKEVKFEDGEVKLICSGYDWDSIDEAYDEFIQACEDGEFEDADDMSSEDIVQLVADAEEYRDEHKEELKKFTNIVSIKFMPPESRKEGLCTFHVKSMCGETLVDQSKKYKAKSLSIFGERYDYLFTLPGFNTEIMIGEVQ